MFKGAIHLHSTYSDGEFTLPELREALVAAGCSFACMTDHAEEFDQQKIRDYRRECEALSDEKFRFVAGLEFECWERMHILGLGVTELVQTQDPQDVIRHIDHHEGVSIIAHPKNEFFDWIETFEALPNGIETWNSKYDSRYAPRIGTFELLGRLKQRRPEMRAFYGIDLHWRHQYRGLFNLVESRSLAREELLTALVNGAYQGVKDDLSLPSNGQLAESMRATFEAAHARSDWMRQVVKQAKSWVKKTGIKVPQPIKAQLRRIF